MRQRKDTPYYLEQMAAHAEAQAIKDAARDAKYARARELLAEGLNAVEVAARLGISVQTARKIRKGLA